METETKRLEAMRGVTSGVEAWVEPVVIPTYPAMPPDPNPMFLERRVYQGSSGKVYPLPVIDRISTEKVDRIYEAIHIENEYLYVMILPELGGRIHIALDKTNDYDFFYRQNVIKPALVGLAGPWISGGVEINWPQHHRPSTFMPCTYHIEEREDGSRVVWLSEHEPMNRMKGMHGVRLTPGSSCLELLGHVYNRTPFVQTFLWWANVAVRVNDDYQSFFPPDVRFVADHAKRAMSAFPECTDHYYGVDYRPGTRLDWYKNIPVPTSYMVTHSDFDFFGGYDHGKKAGFVHVADRHIAPGKKQWTWGNHPFGWAWDRSLTDSDGPYVELMAGVYTDNQPDFSFLAPYETRNFKQVWYPIQEIGPVSNATEDAAISVQFEGELVRIGVCASRVIEKGVLTVELDGASTSEEVSISPGKPWIRTFPRPAGGEIKVSLGETCSTGVSPVVSTTVPVVVSIGSEQAELASTVEQGGTTDPATIGLLRQRGLSSEQALPAPATEPAEPHDVTSVEELYLIGLHLDQYRHATRKPEAYWQEALRRDPLDSRCNTAMANWRLRQGEYQEAEQHARFAIERLTARNPNPRDGEAYYVLGIALERQGKLDEALAATMKATWNYEWAAAAHYRATCLKLRRGDRLEASATTLRTLGEFGNARHLLATLERLAGKPKNAALAAIEKDPLSHWALREASLTDPTSWEARWKSAMRGDPQNYLDLAIDFAEAGLTGEAIDVLDEIAGAEDAMVAYARNFYSGENRSVPRHQATLFPSRLEEIDFLRAADPADAQAPYLLGNLLYDRGRYQEAIQEWERSVSIDPDFSIPWRNLGIAYFNILQHPARARDAFDRALSAAPSDARVLYERDQLLKGIGASSLERLAELEPRLNLVDLRDDLSLELCSIYNDIGRPEAALSILQSRKFAPWEGGEGVALGEWSRTHLILGCNAYESGQSAEALKHFLAADNPPENLGEARHLLANASDVWFWIGEANAALGHNEEAERWWTRAAEFHGNFQEMAVREFSEMTYFQALSLRRLDRNDEANSLLENLLAYSRELEHSIAKIDYFATSLPTMLLFEDDIQERQNQLARELQNSALRGLGQTTK